MWTCRNCKTENYDNSRYCMHCGAVKHGAESDDLPEGRLTRRIKVQRAVIASLCVLLLGLGTWVLTGRKAPSSETGGQAEETASAAEETIPGAQQPGEERPAAEGEPPGGEFRDMQTKEMVKPVSYRFSVVELNTAPNEWMFPVLSTDSGFYARTENYTGGSTREVILWYFGNDGSGGRLKSYVPFALHENGMRKQGFSSEVGLDALTHAPDGKLVGVANWFDYWEDGAVFESRIFTMDPDGKLLSLTPIAEAANTDLYWMHGVSPVCDTAGNLVYPDEDGILAVSSSGKTAYRVACEDSLSQDLQPLTGGQIAVVDWSGGEVRILDTDSHRLGSRYRLIGEFEELKMIPAYGKYDYCYVADYCLYGCCLEDGSLERIVDLEEYYQFPDTGWTRLMVHVAPSGTITFFVAESPDGTDGQVCKIGTLSPVYA